MSFHTATETESPEQLFNRELKIFSKAIQDELARHPERDELTTEEQSKILNVTDAHPRVYGILMNLFYIKDGPVLSTLLNQGDKDFLVEFKEKYIALIHFAIVGRGGSPWVYDAPLVDWGWHDTIVASIVARYAPEARISLVKSCDADTMNDAPYPLILGPFMTAGIYKAVHQGCDIINIRAGLGNDLSYLREACQYAYKSNVVIVAASPYYVSKFLGNVDDFPGKYRTTLSITGIDRYEDGSYGYWDPATSGNGIFSRAENFRGSC